MGSFAELTRQVHLLNDLILSDLVYSEEDSKELAENFSRHLYLTRHWFMRTSFTNKKRFVIALLHDIRSAWALSLVLKSIWTSRTKDGVLSFWHCGKTLIPYDQIPIDHNRTAKPVKDLAQVMTDERRWFHTLEPEAQAMMLLELLYTAGGPLMWDVLHIAQLIYEHNRDLQLQNLQECIVVNDKPQSNDQALDTDKVLISFWLQFGALGLAKMQEQDLFWATLVFKYDSADIIALTKVTKRDNSPPKPKTVVRPGSGDGEDGFTTDKALPTGRAQKNLEANEAAWNSVIKTIRDTQKLEELEMTFDDGTKRKIWKVNRPRPEATETIDSLQLLPATIGKRILSLLPKQTLKEYARVNKYWAYLVEDLQIEWTARNKLNSDLEKLQDMMLKHDTSMDIITVTPNVAGGPASVATGSIAQSITKCGTRKTLLSTRASEKSAFSFRHYFNEKMKNSIRIKPKVILNLADLQERLDRRGATDENLGLWCRYIIKMTKTKKEPHVGSGLLRFEDMRFPTPLMKYNLHVPLEHIIKKDPAFVLTGVPKVRKNITEGSMDLQKEPRAKRFSLRSRDFSSLYKVLKVASYELPA